MLSTTERLGRTAGGIGNYLGGSAQIVIRQTSFIKEITQSISTMASAKEMFDGTLELGKACLSVTGIRQLLDSQDVERLLTPFNRYGFAILECDPIENMAEDFLCLAKIFGNITQHNRSDEKGIVTIGITQGFSAYLGASHEPHPLHTDGPFEKTPPKVMALQCETPDPTGGLSLLVSSKAIYRYLLQQDYKGLELLFNPYIFSVQRDNQFERKAIFECKDDRIGMVYRSNDGKANVSNLSEANSVFSLIRIFIQDPKNQLKFKLKKGNILVVDNTSVLHGRTGFSPNSLRKLNRLNFDGISSYSSKILFGFEA